MAELPDLAYNQSVPANWWETDLWTPTRFCYALDTYGHQGWGADTIASACEANNAYLCLLYFKALGWSFQTICAAVANYQSESKLDPRNWNTAGDIYDGFGLPHWTPQRQYQHWAENIWEPTDPFAPYYYNGWYELYILASEPFGYPHSQWVKHTTDPNGNPASGSQYYPGYPPSGPPDQNYLVSFLNWCAGDIPSYLSTVNQRLDYLTGAYYWNYEQVADYTEDYSLPQRRNRARNWYNRFLPYFGDFAGRTVYQPREVPGPDYTMNDIRNIYPPWMYKIFYNATHRQGAWSQYAR